MQCAEKPLEDRSSGLCCSEDHSGSERSRIWKQGAALRGAEWRTSMTEERNARTNQSPDRLATIWSRVGFHQLINSSVSDMEQPAHSTWIHTATLTRLFSYNTEHVFFILGDWEGFGTLTHLLRWWQKHLFALAIRDGKLQLRKCDISDKPHLLISKGKSLFSVCLLDVSGLSASAAKEKTFNVQMNRWNGDPLSANTIDTNGWMENEPLRKSANHFRWLASQGQSHQRIECFAIAAAYHFYLITIRSRAGLHLTRLKDYLLPLVEVEHGQGRLIDQ